jgi:hypothetical protein
MKVAQIGSDPKINPTKLSINPTGDTPTKKHNMYARETNAENANQMRVMAKIYTNKKFNGLKTIKQQNQPL